MNNTIINIILLTIVYVVQYNTVEEVLMIDNSVKENLFVELRRGTLILSVLSQLQEKKYGYSLLQDLQDLGVSIEPGTLYPMLRRLQKQEILISEWDTNESKPRKYYVLSNDGIDLFEELVAEWEKVKDDIDRLI